MGPELEITGYGCEDHFLEEDTIRHSWECVYRLMRDGYTNDLLCDVGMPVRYKGKEQMPFFERKTSPGCVYNCRIVMLNCEILLIRPKISLANDDNYRETRQTFKRCIQREFLDISRLGRRIVWTSIFLYQNFSMIFVHPLFVHLVGLNPQFR